MLEGEAVIKAGPYCRLRKRWERRIGCPEVPWVLSAGLRWLVSLSRRAVNPIPLCHNQVVVRADTTRPGDADIV